MAFKFKKFSISDDNSSLKVTTDAVMLGAWVKTGTALSILDIGTGCGIIALMLAQQSDAFIDGIDIDAPSIEQAKENVQKTKWGKKINMFHSSLQNFTKVRNNHYDLIVCNPPYFKDGLKSPDKVKNIAKHSEFLSFDEIISNTKKIIKIYGRLCVILPQSESIVFKEKALINSLYLTRVLNVRHYPNRQVKRVLMQFESLRKNRVEENITIYNDEDDTFTQEYKNLTKDYYLKF